ncbi:MAG TPA: zf-TFIIB domain-containing protein [Nocardioidaceae bacterium]|nr:zf-TFIIB domain-containing protein [Nocardioidaceae bacterium]
MKCPIDDNVLQMTDRNGIEIDYCPECRGVWLDRGELDKIIDRSVGAAPAPPQRPQTPQQAYPAQPQPQQQDQRYYKKKRKESFLGELFDF